MADADDDISDPELQPHATPGGATAGPQGPFPNPFSPVVGSPTAGGVDMSQMVAMMQQMMMTSEAAAQAAAAAVQAVRGGTSGNAGASSVSGFSDANKVLSRPANFGSTDHGFDLSQWQDWAHSFRTWLIFADGRYEEELAHVEAHLSTRVVIIRFSTHWHWLCRGRDCLVVADSHTGSRNAWALPRKGGTESMRYATAELCRYLNVLGHNEVTLKSDNEPTCLALKAAVKAYRTKLGLKTHREAPEPGDHQSNPAEQAIEFLRQLTCTILAEYEKEAKTAIGSLDPIHGWAWRHAGWMAHRFVKSHGITSFELVTGRPYNGKIISFGETCFGRIRSKVKGHPRWVRMLWLGKLTVSDARSRRLYAILATVLHHKPKSILKQVQERSGFEVWRQLNNVFAPRSKVRAMALLNAVMAYPVFEKSKTLREQVDGLERVCGEYEHVSGRAIDPNVMLGSLMRCLPQAIRQHVQLSMTEESTYESVRSYILAYEITTTSWSVTKVHQSLGIVDPPVNPDVVPMEVDAVQKGKRKGGRGNSKGKGA